MTPHSATTAKLLGASPPHRRDSPLLRSPFLAEAARSAYELQPFWAEDAQQARTTIQRHADLGISLADASIVVLAARHQIQDVLTLHERHFRVLLANRRPFRLLLADA